MENDNRARTCTETVQVIASEFGPESVTESVQVDA